MGSTLARAAPRRPGSRVFRRPGLLSWPCGYETSRRNEGCALSQGEFAPVSAHPAPLDRFTRSFPQGDFELQELTDAGTVGAGFKG